MSLLVRFLNLLRSNRHSRDLDRELAFHLRERADDLIASGMSPAGAAAEARRRFGNYGAAKEDARTADVLGWLDSLSDDVRYALRALRNSPGFAAVAVLSLALGIGANTAIFTLVNAVVLRSLPVSHPEQLAQVTLTDAGSGGRATSVGGTFTNPLWEQLRDRQTVFSGLAAFSTESFNLAPSGEARYAAGSLVKGGYFAALGVSPAVGRLLTEADDRRGCAPIVVLSYGFWQSEFGGAPDAVGRTLRLNGHPFTVVGVARDGFDGLVVGRATRLFAPLCADAVLNANNRLERRSTWWLQVIGRVKPGLGMAQVKAGLGAIAAGSYAETVPPNWRAQEQAEYRRRGFDATLAANGVSYVRRQYTTALVALMVIVGLVLLIACANVANLLLARAAGREREMAVRVALGARRGRIVRQLLTESILLSSCGGLLGLAFAHWGSRMLVALISTSSSTIALDLTLDRTVLAFSTVMALGTGLGFGLAPAWRAARVAPNAALKANGRGIASGRHRVNAGKVLVVAQVAISLALLVGAGLLLRSFQKLTDVDPGFRADQVLLVSLRDATSAASRAKVDADRAELLERLRALPGVTGASLSTLTPLSNSTWNEELLVDGFAPASFDDGLAWFNSVSDGYFHALETPLVVGRDFTAADGPSSPKVAIVNESMAHRFYGSANPVGRTFRYQVGREISGVYRIVGVTRDAKYQSIRETPQPTVFIPLAQDEDAASGVTVELRLRGGVASAVPGIKSAIAEVNPRYSLRFITFSEQIADGLARDRLLAMLSGFFGALALLLAVLGLYGVLSYNVERRRNEIGIRVALGAGQARVAGMVIREVGLVVCGGLVLGTGLSLGLTRFLSSFLFGLEPSDPAMMALAMALLSAVALAAAYLPARRAAGVDPMEALRGE